MKSSLSLVMPVFNEEQGIERTVQVAMQVLGEISPRYEIILVNDASTDQTPAILERLAAANPCLRVYHHEKNRKLGGSLKTGFAHASNDIVIYSDSDMPFNFYDLKRAVQIVETVDADIVAAYRNDRTSEPWYRIVYTIVYNWMIRWLYRIHVRDVNFACKVFKKTVLDQIMPFKAEGSFISAEILIRAKRMGFYICQIGIDYFCRRTGESTLASPKIIFKIFYEMFRLFPVLSKIKPLQKAQK